MESGLTWKSIEDDGDVNIFYCLAHLQNSNTFFQDFDDYDDDDYDIDDDDDYDDYDGHENLSGDASIVWHNWFYQGHLLKDDEQEPLKNEALIKSSSRPKGLPT